MVPQEEFQRVRVLIENALAEEFRDFLVPPAELEPGTWVMWPLRDIEVKLEETMYWSYGKPVGASDRLQAHIHWPYGHDERIRPRPADAPFTEKLAKRAATVARIASDAQSDHLRTTSREKQEAYLFGYRVVWDLPEERREFLWPAREETTRQQWTLLHNTIKTLFMNARRENYREWDRLFAGEEQYLHPREWSPRDPRGYNPSTFDMFFRGAVDALDDWSKGSRFYD